MLAVILLLAIVALSSWFLYKDDIKRAIIPDALQTPDYILDHFEFSSYTPLGQLDYRVKGVYMEHLPDSRLFHINDLSFNALRDNKLAWEASAKRAKLEEDTHIMNLSGDIRITYYAEDEASPVHLRTEAMTIYAKRDYAKNRHPTLITFASGSIKSRGGIEIDGKARTLKMFGGISGEIEHE